MQSTGRALLFTSVVLTSGFLVLTFSDMLNLEQVGVLTSFAVMSAFLLDVTVTPALLVLTHGGRDREDESLRLVQQSQGRHGYAGVEVDP